MGLNLRHEPGFYMFHEGHLAGPFPHVRDAARYAHHVYGYESDNAVVFEVKGRTEKSKMDPNEVYDQITDIVNANLAGAIPPANAVATLDELSGLIESLDIWLKSGGFKPEAWRDRINPAHVVYYEGRDKREQSGVS